MITRLGEVKKGLKIDALQALKKQSYDHIKLTMEVFASSTFDNLSAMEKSIEMLVNIINDMGGNDKGQE